MDLDLNINKISDIVFEPSHLNSIKIPSIRSDFPAVPSAMYYYTSKTDKKNRIAMLNNVGTPEEQELSLLIWYSLKSDQLFPLNTVYAKARSEQLLTNNETLSNDHQAKLYSARDSEISLSMKSQLRQVPDSSDWFFIDRFQLILGQMKERSLDKLVNDMYRFPLHPLADPFEAARLMEQYFDTGKTRSLEHYLRVRGVTHLENHPLEYYPAYELFFLLTRFASYPMSEYQLALAQRRKSTKFGSPERIFIDAVWYLESQRNSLHYNVDDMIALIDKIAFYSDEIMSRLNTSFEDWVKWGDEYIYNADIVPQPIEYLGNRISVLAEEIYTWNDNQLVELARKLDFDLPIRSEFPTRRSWVQTIAAIISRFRANATID